MKSNIKNFNYHLSNRCFYSHRYIEDLRFEMNNFSFFTEYSFNFDIKDMDKYNIFLNFIFLNINPYYEKYFKNVTNKKLSNIINILNEYLCDNSFKIFLRTNNYQKNDKNTIYLNEADISIELLNLLNKNRNYIENIRLKYLTFMYYHKNFIKEQKLYLCDICHNYFKVGNYNILSIEYYINQYIKEFDK